LGSIVTTHTDLVVSNTASIGHDKDKGAVNRTQLLFFCVYPAGHADMTETTCSHLRAAFSLAPAKHTGWAAALHTLVLSNDRLDPSGQGFASSASVMEHFVEAEAAVEGEAEAGEDEEASGEKPAGQTI